jgi:hypothetical protein
VGGIVPLILAIYLYSRTRLIYLHMQLNSYTGAACDYVGGVFCWVFGCGSVWVGCWLCPGVGQLVSWSAGL